MISMAQRETLKEGWALYAAGRAAEVIELFEAARSDAARDVEMLYLLGMAFKKLGQNDRAVQAFQEVVSLAAALPNRDRGAMIRRLAQGHVHFLARGVWDLEDGWQETG